MTQMEVNVTKSNVRDGDTLTLTRDGVKITGRATNYHGDIRIDVKFMGSFKVSDGWEFVSATRMVEAPQLSEDSGRTLMWDGKIWYSGAAMDAYRDEALKLQRHLSESNDSHYQATLQALRDKLTAANTRANAWKHKCEVEIEDLKQRLDAVAEDQTVTVTKKLYEPTYVKIMRKGEVIVDGYMAEYTYKEKPLTKKILRDALRETYIERDKTCTFSEDAELIFNYIKEH